MNRLINYGADDTFFAEAARYPEQKLARVVAHYGDLYRIVTEQGEGLGEISGKFRHGILERAGYPVVGDFVMADRKTMESGNAVIYRVLRRKSAFERTAVSGAQQTQVVAANIDTVFICMALNNDYNPSRLERYLSAVWGSGANPVVVLTKSDVCSDLARALSEISSVIVGVDRIITSNRDSKSHLMLFPYILPGRTASFVGSSGIGKLTLINRLLGKDFLDTSATRKDDKGRHTNDPAGTGLTPARRYGY